MLDTYPSDSGPAVTDILSWGILIEAVDDFIILTDKSFSFSIVNVIFIGFFCVSVSTSYFL